jgi:hypothetical protein
MDDAIAMVLVTAVKVHALQHYNDGGWDVIVECWDDGEILAEITRDTTPSNGEEAIAAIQWIVDEYASRQNNARIEAGETGE